MKVLIITFCMASVVLLQVESQGVVSLPSTNGEALTLQDYLCGEDKLLKSNTILQLSQTLPHYFNRSGFCIINDLSNVTIQGVSSSQRAVIVCNDQSSETTQTGFGFVNMTDITFQNIHFQRCGGILPRGITDFIPQTVPTLFTGPRQQAVLFLVNCFNAEFWNVKITEYFGYGAIAFNVLGSFEMKGVQVSSSYSEINKLTQINDDFLKSGSGVLIFYRETGDSHLGNLTNTTLTIIDTNLTFNTNLFPLSVLEEFSYSAVELAYNPLPLPGAGGLTIIFTQQTYFVETVLNDSLIVNNSGTVVGGFLIGHPQNIGLTSVKINNCLFENNFVFPNSFFQFVGAALQIFFVFPPTQSLAELTDAASDKEQIDITNTSFIGNYGSSGSAINIFSGAQNISEIKLTLRKILFLKNEAREEGDCMYIYSEKSILFSQSKIYVLMDQITYVGTTAILPRGTVFSFLNIGEVWITGSDGQPSVFNDSAHSVIRAFSSNVFITGSVIFQNNSAVSGAAIFLIANSYLFFEEPTDVQFLNNTASIYGGAIYTDALSGDQCVVQFLGLNVIFNVDQLSSLDVNITFLNNSAFLGNAIYAAPIYNCRWFMESAIQTPRDYAEVVYQTFFNFPSQNETFFTQIRSDPEQVCFCSTENDGEIVCVDEPIYSGITPNGTYPGRTFGIQVVPVDEAKRSVTALMFTQLLGNNEVRFTGNVKIVASLVIGAVCANEEYTLFNQENITVELQFGVTDSSTVITTTLPILECPDGFQLDSDSGICDCSPLYQSHNLVCDIQSGLIRRQEREWIGLAFVDTEPTPAYAVRCPTDYCNKSVSDIELSKNTLCTQSRKGAICGQCKDGFSTVFGSVECGECSNFWLFTIPLYMLAGILLVFLLFALQLTISEGTIIGLIYYAQVVSINGDLLLTRGSDSHLVIVFISLLNLDLGFPLCFYDGMDLVAKVGMQFVFPVYIWLIVITIIYLGRFSKYMQEVMGETPVHVLVTLMYLSFTKLLRSVVTIFIASKLLTENGSFDVWFFDGSVIFFTDRHLFLGILAIATTIFFIIPYKTFLLLVQWLACVPKINYFKPLIDANIAAFKDAYRFWFGLRLFVIGIKVILTISLTANFPATVLFVQLLINFPYTVVQAYLQPFRSKFLNLLDLFFLTNYNIFVFTRLYLGAAMHINSENFLDSLVAIQVICIGSVFIVFIGIIVYHIWYHTVPRFKKLRSKNKPKHSPNDVTTSEVTLDESGDTEMPRMYTTSDINDFVWADGNRLRESLLED